MVLNEIVLGSKIASGNCKVAKTEMVWGRDKIGRPNQSDTIGNSRRHAKKWQSEK